MNQKKIFWMILLVIFIIAVIAIVAIAKPRDTSADSTVRVANNTNTVASSIDAQQRPVSYKKAKLEDGILYSATGEKVEADFKIGDNYFDTTINDMYLNPDNYANKNIEIEGMYLSDMPYTFVGRYTTTSLCPYCSGGYSYIQYKFDAEMEEELKDEDNWIKLIGTWEKETVNMGTENNPYYGDNYYLKVSCFELMNEKGQATVKN